MASPVHAVRRVAALAARSTSTPRWARGLATTARQRSLCGVPSVLVQRPQLSGRHASPLRSSRPLASAAAAAEDPPTKKEEAAPTPAIAPTSTLVWGDGTEGQLGHYPFERTGVLKAYTELSPRRLTVIDDDEEPVVFAKIACGTNHTLAIDTKGAVWSWGKSDYGKCGHGSSASNAGNSSAGGADQPYPKRVEALRGVAAESVACGEFHSAVVDTEGRLYTWGWGGSWLSGGGHLGHGDRRDAPYPTLVKLLDDGGYRVKSVSCGEAHTLVLTDDGEALSCGAGEHGRNGNGSSRDVLAPEPVPYLESDDVVQLEAGSAFSMALTAADELYVWGRNDQGQLGLGGGLAMDVYAMEDIPRKVDLRISSRPLVGEQQTSSSSSSEGVNADDAPPQTPPPPPAPQGSSDGDAEAPALAAAHIAAGHSHAAVVTRDGRLLFWGMKAYLDPFPVHFAEGHTPVKAFGGGNFTFVLASDGSLHSFGLGRTTALGHGDKRGLSHPKRLVGFEGHGTVLDVAAGFRHIAVVCGDAASSEEAPAGQDS